MTERNIKEAAVRSRSGTSRRGFLGTLGLTPGFATLAGAGLLEALRPAAALADVGPLTPAERRHRAFVIRRDAAIFQRDVPPTPSVSNGDYEAYANRIASFTKALPHNDLGEVDLNAYNAYLQALNSGKWDDFEAIPLGGAAKLTNPQAAYCYSMEGADAAVLASPPGPSLQQRSGSGGDGGGLLAGTDSGRALQSVRDRPDHWPGSSGLE